MNAELEKIVESVLANGELSYRSRELLIKKAEQLGVDLLDFELELESKIAQKKTSASGPLPIYTSTTPQSNKEGNLKKCPSCGASVQSFNTKCSDCGHEFRGVNSTSSITQLFEELKIADEEERKKPMNKWTENEQTKLAAVANRQKSIISSFPVPNTKEDLLEFLSISSSEAQKKLGFCLYKNIDPHHILKNAWRAKCEQVILKARFSMKDDKKTLEEIEGYAKQLGIK